MTKWQVQNEIEREKHMDGEKQVIPARHIHAGIYTIKSHKTGEHRTFEVATQSLDAKFKPGARLVSMLIGPDNTRNYKAFGELVEAEDGTPVFKCWQKYVGTQYEKNCHFLVQVLRDGGHPQVDLLSSTFCMRCGRPLTTPESVREGIGPVCREMVFGFC